MKKTVFCVALVAALFLAVPANAQFKFGPKVGMNISTLSLSGNLSYNFKKREHCNPYIFYSAVCNVLFFNKQSKPLQC